VISGTITAAALCLAMQTSGLPRANYACKHAKQVVKVCKKHKINPAVFVALVSVESNWRPHVVSKDNACGLTQVLPQYSRYTCDQLKKPKTSIKEGGSKLKYWLHRYGKSNYLIGLCGYNKGHRCHTKKPNKRGMRYSRKVLKLALSVYRHLPGVKSEKASFSLR